MGNISIKTGWKITNLQCVTKICWTLIEVNKMEFFFSHVVWVVCIYLQENAGNKNGVGHPHLTLANSRQAPQLNNKRHSSQRLKHKQWQNKNFFTPIFSYLFFLCTCKTQHTHGGFQSKQEIKVQGLGRWYSALWNTAKQFLCLATCIYFPSHCGALQ